MIARFELVLCLCLMGTIAGVSHPEASQAQPPGPLLARIYPEASAMREKILWLDEGAQAQVRAKARAPFDEPHVSYTEIAGAGGVAGYAFVDDVKGLHEMITYLAALNSDGTVRAVEILAYREAYGFEIKHERFRRQFVGKRLEDPIRVGADIRNIAGATISTNAISTGVRKILALYEVGIKGMVTQGDNRNLPPSPRPSPARGGRGGLQDGYLEHDSGASIRRSRPVWGTTLTVEAADTDRGRDVLEAAFRDVESLTPVFSRYDTASEITRLNARPGEWHDPSVDFAALFDLSMSAARETKGWFDPTKRREGLSHVHLDGGASGRPARMRLDTGTALDFDGIAKGYAVDRVIRILRSAGISSGLVNFGESSIAAIGSPAGAGRWQISVRDPRRPKSVATQPLLRLAIRDAVVSVSGAYERGPHIIDPFTGKPPPDSLLAVVVGPLAAWDGARSDAWSTALFACGPKLLADAGAAGFEALWLGPAGPVRTKGFSAYEEGP
ncbi:MAG: hypothetical protein A3G34_08090 [Candidatus Lindowbacteria bacterium RIFCSPLOWO2_12_FULL_62_27]|nr:MAG: hypothetical protein A3G34_08090 [Candidatus Lindowbacteria bacterium RIFCSPLOWO2_12_FULL_62_27]